MAIKPSKSGKTVIGETNDNQFDFPEFLSTNKEARQAAQALAGRIVNLAERHINRTPTTDEISQWASELVRNES